MKITAPRPVQIQTWRQGNVLLTREVEELSFEAGDIYFMQQEAILTELGTANIQYKVHLRGAKGVQDAFERFDELFQANAPIDRPEAVAGVEQQVKEYKAKQEQERIARMLRGGPN